LVYWQTQNLCIVTDHVDLPQKARILACPATPRERVLDARAGRIRLDDRDIWQAALLLVKRCGNDAMLKAAHADQLQENGDWQGAVSWHRILDCIERIRIRRRARLCIDSHHRITRRRYGRSLRGIGAAPRYFFHSVLEILRLRFTAADPIAAAGLAGH
jgi:hypothetical protein